MGSAREGYGTALVYSLFSAWSRRRDCQKRTSYTSSDGSYHATYTQAATINIFFLTHTKKSQKQTKILSGRNMKILSSISSIIQLAKRITSRAESQILPAENGRTVALAPTWPDPAQLCGTWYLHRAERSSLALAP